jgi:SecD/SecF fusion protein
MPRFLNRAIVYGLLILMVAGGILPSLLSDISLTNMPSWYSASQPKLGLDLRGGSQLTMAVDTQGLLTAVNQSLVEDLIKSVKGQAITLANTQVSSESIDLLVPNPAQQTDLVDTIGEKLKQRISGRYAIHIDGKYVHLRLEKNYRDILIDDAVERSREIIRQRIDATGVIEPSIFRQGSEAIVIQLPGVSDPERIRQLLGSTAQLSFYLVAESGNRLNTLTLPGTQANSRFVLQKPMALAGEHITDARLGFAPDTGEALVSFRLDTLGAQRFARLTKDNIHRQLAIVVDDKVISAPVINSAIPGGSGEISGNFTPESASDLALLLRSGALPAQLQEIERHSVGPQLGGDAIQSGLITGLVGAVLVLVFMLAAYGRWAFIAWAGLAVTSVLVFATLSLLQATLTLPGIAGLILTLGMAVDANILINERIREERTGGAKSLAAVTTGFDRAFITILDANLTTLIAVALLFFFGNGPLRGFAITIAVGLCATLVVTRAITLPLMVTALRLKRQHWLPSIKPRFATRFSRRNFNFMGVHLRGLIISLLLSAGSIALLATQGLALGVDFSGGSSIKAYNTGLESNAVRGIIGDGASLQTLGATGDYLVRLPAGQDNNAALINQIQTNIQALSPQAQFDISSISAQVSQDFFAVSIVALLLAAAGMGLYLWARYQSYFALSAIVTLGLDLTKIFGLLALFQIEFNLVVIAALLALIGYSINDKVVVFDRIRDKLRQHQHNDLHQLLNDSVNATLKRTLYTSITTAIAILPMAIAGGSVVSNFAIPLLFGIVICTSSSIFIAAPLILSAGKKRLAENRDLLQMTNDELRQQQV